MICRHPLSPPTDLEALLQHRGWVRALARTLVRDAHRADDVEQEAWLVALRRPPANGRSLRAWFGRVVRSRATDATKSDARRVARETAVARPDAMPSAFDVAATTELHRRLVHAVQELDEPYRSAVILRFFDDLPPRAIAARFGVPVETARTHVKRGVEQLRRRLDAAHRGDRDAWRAALLPLVAPSWRTDLTGGVLVTTTTQKTMTAAALLALLLLLGGGAWWATRSDAPMSQSTASDDAPGKDASTREARAPRARAVDDTLARSATPVTTDEDTPRAVDRPVVAVVDTVTGEPVASPHVRAVGVDGDETSLDVAGGGVRELSLDPALIGRTVTLWVSAPGHATRRLENVTLAAERRVVELTPASPLAITFVTESGRTLSADEVRARFGGEIPAGTFQIVTDAAIRGGDVTRMMKTAYGPAGEWCAPLDVAAGDGGWTTMVGVESGRWRVFVRRPAATPWLSDPLVFDGAGGGTVTVPLPESPRLRTVRFVADDTREPLTGAALVPYHEYGDNQAYLRGGSLTTDARGEASVPWDPVEIARGRPPVWWVSAPGRIGRFRAEDNVVAVPRSVVVEGTAFLPDGGAAVGHLVAVGGKGRLDSALVDGQGRFELECPRTADGNVEVRLFTTRDRVAFVSAVVHAEPDQDTVTLTIGARAVPGTLGRVEGVVTAGGRPVAGALVFDDTKGSGETFVATGADGRFVLEGLDVADPHWLTLVFGDPKASKQFRARADAPLRLTAGAATSLAFDLPAGVVRVRVVDPEGRPLARTCVFGAPTESGSERARFPGFAYSAGWAAFTDDDGDVLLRGLIPGVPHTITVRADGFERGPEARREFVTPGNFDAPAEVELRLVRKR